MSGFRSSCKQKWGSDMGFIRQVTKKEEVLSQDVLGIIVESAGKNMAQDPQSAIATSRVTSLVGFQVSSKMGSCSVSCLRGPNK